MKCSIINFPLKVIKIVFTIFLLLNITHIFADDIGVSARVGTPNRSPNIVSISPSYSPVVLSQNSVQLFALKVGDLDGDTITYTITPDNGAATPLNGTISNTTQLQNEEAYINFIYLSSSNLALLGASQITVTLNDGVNPVVIQKIDMYTF